MAIGPVISEGQLKRVLEYIEIGKTEGATARCRRCAAW
jgi:acyl-CoA reductase-like NAD-dependent aldehyde dehydrogenase